MFSPPEHSFEVEGGRFLFVKFSQAGLRRINQSYAMKLSITGIIPNVLEVVCGTALYHEALLEEGLKEAPTHWWEDLPARAGTNGTPAKVLSFETVPPEEFEAVAKEVDTFLESFRQPPADNIPDGSETAPGTVAAAETVPPSAPLRAY